MPDVRTLSGAFCFCFAKITRIIGSSTKIYLRSSRPNVERSTPSLSTLVDSRHAPAGLRACLFPAPHIALVAPGGRKRHHWLVGSATLRRSCRADLGNTVRAA